MNNNYERTKTQVAANVSDLAHYCRTMMEVLTQDIDTNLHETEAEQYHYFGFSNKTQMVSDIKHLRRLLMRLSAAISAR